MHIIILYFIIVIFITYSFYLLYQVLKIPNKIQKEYGKPIISFWTLYYRFFPHPSAINFIFMALYNDFLIIKGLNENYLINKDNFVEFKNKTLFKPYSIKFKTSDIYKYKEIPFSFLLNKKAQILKKYTDNLK